MQKSFYLAFNSTSTRQEPWAVKIFARLARAGKNGISKRVREMYQEMLLQLDSSLQKYSARLIRKQLGIH
jgi:hypothetical protein